MNKLKNFLFDKCSKFALVMLALSIVEMLLWIVPINAMPTMIESKNVYHLIEVFIRYFVIAKTLKAFGLKCLQDDYKK